MREDGVLVRFWMLDHGGRANVMWPPSSWPRLVYAYTGTLLVEGRNQAWVLPPNRALWVLPGESSRAACFGPCQVRSLFLHPAHAPALESRSLSVRPLFRELILEACHSGPLLAARPDDAALARLLSRELLLAPAASPAIALPQQRAGSADGMPTAEEAARSAGISRRTLDRRAARAGGVSHARQMQQARLLGGVEALAAGELVEVAAMKAGYASTSAFIHAFRRQFGVTPGRWAG